jgi:hypothetical protein
MNNQPQSFWREFNFAYNQVKRAIEPCLLLKDMFKGWSNISKSLAERPRIRNTQLTKYFRFE